MNEKSCMTVNEVWSPTPPTPPRDQRFAVISFGLRFMALCERSVEIDSLRAHMVRALTTQQTGHPRINKLKQHACIIQTSSPTELALNINTDCRL